MKLLILFIVLSAFTLTVFAQMELTKVRVKSSTIFSNAGGKMKLDDFDGFQYYGVFTMGTPAQQTTIITDTGSDQLWIPTDKQTCYRASASSTANITKTKGNIQYGQGYVAGHMGTEMLGAPELGLTNLKMATLFVDEERQMSGQKACGLMGLSNHAVWKNFLEVAVSDGKLADAQFAFKLKNPDKTTLFYAGSASFPVTVTWFKVVRQNYWAIELKNTIIDGHTYEQPDGMKEAVLDTGTSLVIMAKNAYDGLIANQEVAKVCQQQQGYVICPCDGTGLPDVLYTSNGHRMRVKPADYLDQLSGSYCMLGFMAGEPSEIPFVILGDVFLRDYFYALDKAKNQLGLYGPGLEAEEQKGFLQ